MAKKRKRIYWNVEMAQKIATAFAAIQVRSESGGAGARMSVKDMMTEAQAMLPANFQRDIRGLAETSKGFRALVRKAREKLIGKQGHKLNGVNGISHATMELVMSPESKIAFEVPPGMILNGNLRKALKHAGFHFSTIDAVTGMQQLFDSKKVESVERLASTQ